MPNIDYTLVRNEFEDDEMSFNLNLVFIEGKGDFGFPEVEFLHATEYPEHKFFDLNEDEIEQVVGFILDNLEEAS